MSPEIIASSLPEFSIYVTATLGRSLNTAKAYVSDVRSLIRFMNRLPPTVAPTSIDAPDLASTFVTWLRTEENNSPATAKRKLAALNTYFTWLVQKGAIERSPIKGSSVNIRLPKRLPRALPRQDVIRLLKSCRKENKKNDNTELALRVLVATGVRISELCAINIGDVSPDGISIRIKGKGNRERTVYVSSTDLHKRLAQACGDRSSATEMDEPLFTNHNSLRLTPQTFRLRLHRLRESSEVGLRVTPHCLRHTAATLLLESGVDIRFVQRLLGHASISTTEIYTRVVDESLRTALLKADPMRGM